MMRDLVLWVILDAAILGWILDRHRGMKQLEREISALSAEVRLRRRTRLE